MQDTPADNLPDSEAMRWVSFAELADTRGISKDSAIRLVRRRGWRRQRDNQGHVRALVPETWLNGQEDRPPDNPGDNPPDATFHVKALSVLEEALTTLRGELGTVRDERDRAQAEARSALERADMHARELAVAQHDAQAAQEAAEALRQAEDARKARGRLRRAWDGWRGR